LTQLLLVGAGFDTRAIRFESVLEDAKVYELDAPSTQGAKVRQYARRGVSVPRNLVFVPIDFEKERMEDRLHEVGFSPEARTLVIAEGVVQYLRPEAVYATLQALHNVLGEGSKVVFDYAHASVLGGSDATYGQAGITKGAERFGESWQFGLEKAEVGPLLAKYGLRLLEIQSPEDLEQRYFRDAAGRVMGRVNGTQSIALAERTKERQPGARGS
jgi:methyltransferase (TIGR00027 family)